MKTEQAADGTGSSERNQHRRGTLRQMIEDNLTLVLLGFLFAGWGAGIGTYEGLVRIAQLKVISRGEYEAFIETAKRLTATEEQLRGSEGELKAARKELTSCRETPTWPRTRDGKYEAVEMASETGQQYQVKEVSTGRPVLSTQGQSNRPNDVIDVKAGLFSPDSTRIAAAYHYTGDGNHRGNYTWVGIWDIESGNRVGEQVIDGWTTNLFPLFAEGGNRNRD